MAKRRKIAPRNSMLGGIGQHGGDLGVLPNASTQQPGVPTTGKRRTFPYIWPTWITPHLAGDALCWFSPWIKSNYQIEKLERGGFDLAAWKVTHAKMVRARADQLKKDGWSVTLEDQNEIKLRGRTAMLAGKPDIVAVKDDEVCVWDCKGGKRRASDIQQVLVYMYALPKVRKALMSKRISGAVDYRDGILTIQPEQFTDEMRTAITTALMKMGGVQPEAVPSPSECGMCDVRAEDCSKRIAKANEEVVTADF